MLGLENSPLGLQESSLSLHSHHLGGHYSCIVLVCCHGGQNSLGGGEGTHLESITKLMRMAKATFSHPAAASAKVEHPHGKLWGS